MMKTILLGLLFIGFVTNTFAQHTHDYKKMVINKKIFLIQTRDFKEEVALLKVYRNGKLIMNNTVDSRGLLGLKFPDFNKDGYPDIMLEYMGNNHSYHLYLFDPKKNVFKSLEGFVRFPASKQLKSNPQYYYSYSRAGCADMNWESDLFRIENFKTIHLAHIDGQGCDFEVDKNPQMIEIYKVLEQNTENKKLIETLPYLKSIQKYENKWKFIESYWSNNYAKFGIATN
jgi:hypothetical protein